jgi:excisionase family DNA binding protein
MQESRVIEHIAEVLRWLKRSKVVEKKAAMTPYEVAEQTGVSLQLIYRELRKGNIPNARCGDKYLISREAFRRWLEGDRQYRGESRS